MKKLALAICACAFVAVAAPSFAEDMSPATDAAAAATDAAPANPSDNMKKAKHHKKHAHKKQMKQQQVAAKQDTAIDAATDNNQAAN